MTIRKGFTDFMIVNDEMRIEYFYIPSPEMYDFRPENLIGTSPLQQYNNLYPSDSTLVKAIERGECTKDCIQDLVTLQGKTIRQSSDTFTVKNEGDVIGAIEFAYYDYNFSSSNKEKLLQDEKKEATYSIENFVGISEEAKELRRKYRKIAKLDSPVLLIGETGTGKELSARIIHNESDRSKSGKFVYVNCSAIPENLMEGILFGVRPGSFTDAEEKSGLFEEANGGTLFLDELDSTPITTQGKILRAIEERRIRPVGADKEISVDIRIIASCSTAPEKIINEKKLRNDLYYRLSVVQFDLLPLREKKEDITILCFAFIEELNKQDTGKGVIGLDQNFKQFVLKYHWPGNVRELKNIIESAYFDTDSNYLRYDDIKDRFSNSCEKNAGYYKEFLETNNTLKEYIESKTKEYIKTNLKYYGGDLRLAAEGMNITVNMLKYNIEKYGVEV